MILYLKIMGCIWVTLAVLRISIDFLTIGWRAKKNKEFIKTFEKMSDNLHDLRLYFLNQYHE